MYLNYDSVTTALLPYFLGLIYFSFFCWIRQEMSMRAAPVLIMKSRPEEVFQIIDQKPSSAKLKVNSPSGTRKTIPKNGATIIQKTSRKKIATLS